VELRAKDFVPAIRDILSETRFVPQHLEVELTETVLLQDSKETAAVLKALKDLGVNIALDDFGTGYSSLSYLTRFPIDTLKIDGTFVGKIDTSESDASIVGTVVFLGKKLRIRVVAEGVETHRQFEILRGQGDCRGQGYYFSPAVAGGEVVKFMGGSLRGHRFEFGQNTSGQRGVLFQHSARAVK